LVKQNNGDDFICNDAHILCLKSTSNKLEKENDYKDIEITAADYYGSTDRFKRYHKGYKVGVDFSHIEVPIDPYWFGLWLGDGNSDAPIITSGDKVKEDLKNLRVLNNKHIPDCYKYNDRQLRLKLLAGLIDSDGNLDKTGAVEFCNTNKVLAEDVLWLARSLGFRSSLNTKKTSIKSVGYSGISYRVRISGKISDIPILLKRKMAVDKTTYNRLQYGIFVNPVGKGEYFGFEIDGDRKFLLGDFTVTHNTTIVSRLIGEIKTYPFMFYVLTKDLMEQAHEELTKYLNQPIGMIGDSKCDIKKITICTIQTAVMALNQGNTKFKISDYIYDDEETWDEKSIDSAEKLENIKKLIQQTKGLYMDECHHTAAKTCKEVLLASPNAYWRFGGSATPNRESGDDIMIQAVFGAKIVDISASYLIKQNWLVKPYIFFEPVRTDVNLHSYQKVYSECVVKNDPLNDHIADTANHLVSRGLSVLVLVQQYAHGDYLKEKIPGSEFMTGRLTSAKRTQILDDMRSGKLKAVIASSLADEGLNVPTLDAVLLAGCGKSSTRLFQRIGRTLRRDKAGKKKKSIVIVYDHNAKYLSKHVKKVKTLLKREEEFVVRSSAGEKFIFKELDDLLGFKNDTKSVFE
jgi:superfamily II DNA or RNA helicase